MGSWRSEWLDWVKALLIAFILAFIIRTFFFSPIIVDGPSMLPTLHDRDQIIVNKFTYRLKEPDRFDIVIFHASAQKDFIKRVIGLPGEHIASEGNQLYVDGEPVEEYFLNEETDLEHAIWTNDFVLEDLPGEHHVIPEGYALLLGDNRNNSTDSRSLGLIAMDEIIGKASFIYWPFKRINIVK